MSEFTAGILFRAARAPEVETAAQHSMQPYKVRPLNYRWAALFLADEALKEPATQALVVGLSRTVPLLQFINAEDHGWAYAIWDQGQERSSFNFDYDVLYDAASEAAKARGLAVHLWSDEGRPYWAEMLALAKQTPDFLRQFENADAAAFGLFELPQADLEGAAAAVAPGFMDSVESPWGRVAGFRRALGIEEMAWKSYHYLEIEEAESRAGGAAK